VEPAAGFGDYHARPQQDSQSPSEDSKISKMLMSWGREHLKGQLSALVAATIVWRPNCCYFFVAFFDLFPNRGFTPFRGVATRNILCLLNPLRVPINALTENF
jgi:hypothetical protein